MTDKNEVLELAKKHGADIFAGRDENGPRNFIEMWPEELFAFVAAIEEKHREQIAMLVNALRTIEDHHGEHDGWRDIARTAIMSIQQSSDAFLAEVRAKAWKEAESAFAMWESHEHPVIALRRWAELRNSAAQPEGKEVK